ncbi:Hypothetical predicted protein [Podarcis lilfordi]|uniref:Uncharacterized protein n=1 Tax=Podarcis lilfordi TaxID=74358 RepID=A0AA35JZ24_9SAUR|nr:Hypothetical predicted protein [Podarcis lilfordi]
MFSHAADLPLPTKRLSNREAGALPEALSPPRLPAHPDTGLLHLEGVAAGDNVCGCSQPVCFKGRHLWATFSVTAWNQFLPLSYCGSPDSGPNSSSRTSPQPPASSGPRQFRHTAPHTQSSPISWRCAELGTDGWMQELSGWDLEGSRREAPRLRGDGTGPGI